MFLFRALQNRILGETEEQIEETFAVVFENYKSLDESSPSGMMDIFRPATGVSAPVLEPAVKLYKLLHDILSPEAQNKLNPQCLVPTIPFSDYSIDAPLPHNVATPFWDVPVFSYLVQYRRPFWPLL